MNREIKFRAWDEKWKRWILPEDITIYGDGTADFVRRGENGDKIEIVELSSGEIILEQFTGLPHLDWWEGDFFEHPSGKCLIVWRNGGLSIHGQGGWTPVADAIHWAELPVKIGNRHDNPELLKGTIHDEEKAK